MNRRDFLAQSTLFSATLLGISRSRAAFATLSQPTEASPSGEPKKPRKVLFFSKSSGYEHSAIKKSGDKPSLVEATLSALAPQHKCEFTFTKDGGIFTPEKIAEFDAFFFYTTGDLTTVGTDGNPAMTPDGKDALLAAIHGGKGFVGTHSATDTFHTSLKDEDRYKNFGDKADLYAQMIGAGFIHHDAQQKARMRVVDTHFPGFSDKSDFEMMEEWYSLNDFRKDLHVLLVQETEGMHGPHYARPPYPATWARKHGKGRVFYTSMGHRDDVWSNPLFQSILLGGLSWAVGDVKADVTPNIETVCPQAWVLPARPAPQPKKP